MENQPTPKKKPSDSYLKYSGFAFQMLGAIAVGFLLGNFLDKRYVMKTPVFTIVFTLFFIIASLVLFIRELTKK